MQLRDKDTGVEIVSGQVVKTFRGEQVAIISTHPPTHAGSTGRVYAQFVVGGARQEFFPSVVNGVWID